MITVKKVLSIMVVTLMMTALMFSAAMAANTPVSVTLDPGALTLTMNGILTFDNISIQTIIDGGGFPYVYPASDMANFTLVDATGSGSGWHVDFKCTALTNPGGKIQEVALASRANETIVRVAGDPVENEAAKGPYITPTTFGAPDFMHNDSMVLNTQAGYGMGTYTYTPVAANYKITFAADNTYAGTYSGTFYATITSGPGGTGGWQGQVQ